MGFQLPTKRVTDAKLDRQPRILIVYDMYEFGVGPLRASATFDLNGGKISTFKRTEAYRVAKAIRQQDPNIKVDCVDIDDMRLKGGQLFLQVPNSPIKFKLDTSQYDALWFRASTRYDEGHIIRRKTEERNLPIAEHLEARIPTFTPFDKLQQLDGKVGTYDYFKDSGIDMPDTVALRATEHNDVERHVREFMEAHKGEKVVLKRNLGAAGTRVAIKSEAPGLSHQIAAVTGLTNDITGMYIGDDVEKVIAKAKAWTKPGEYRSGAVLQAFVDVKHAETRRAEVIVDHAGEIHVPYGVIVSETEFRELTMLNVTTRSKHDPIQFTDEEREFIHRTAKHLGPGRWGIDYMGTPPKLLEANPFSSTGAIPFEPQHRGLLIQREMAHALIDFATANREKSPLRGADIAIT